MTTPTRSWWSTRQETSAFAGGNIETLVGLSREEAMAMSIWEYVHPEDFESAAGAFNEATRTTGYHLPTAFRIRGAGDEWIEAEITGTTFDCLEGVWLVIAIRRRPRS
ncbi:MAG: PAS domain-containing protein [Microthrixaceae bacterium]